MGGAGSVDYLIGGGFNDTIEGNDGMDLVFGDHAFLTFYEDESHRLRYARTINHSCSGGFDTIDLGSGDVRYTLYVWMIVDPTLCLLVLVLELKHFFSLRLPGSSFWWGIRGYYYWAEWSRHHFW